MRDSTLGICLFIFIFAIMLICLTLTNESEKVIGTNINNETKEYVRIIDDSYGITKDGTRELLKSYKYKK